MENVFAISEKVIKKHMYPYWYKNTLDLILTLCETLFGGWWSTNVLKLFRLDIF